MRQNCALPSLLSVTGSRSSLKFTPSIRRHGESPRAQAVAHARVDGLERVGFGRIALVEKSFSHVPPDAGGAKAVGWCEHAPRRCKVLRRTLELSAAAIAETAQQRVPMHATRV